MKTTPDDKNVVFLREQVQGMYTSPKVSRLYLMVKDYQQKADEDGRHKRNTVTITFYGREGLKALDGINKYNHVDVRGIMQSVRDPKTGRWGQECWGISVSKTPTLIELATKGEITGGTYPEDDNLVVIRGKVSACHAYSKHWITLSVKTQVTDSTTDSRYLSNTTMTWYVSDAAVVLHELEREGAEVVLIGKIESVERTNSKDGKTYMYENVTVRDLKIISDMPKSVTETLVAEMQAALTQN